AWPASFATPAYASSKRSQNRALRLPSLRTYLIGRELKENRNDEDSDNVDHLDHRIDRRPCCVLVRAAHGIASYRGRMRGRPFPAVIPFFDKFLGVVPGATAAGHGNRHK